ncbi:GNAT family N-acetyltransferase [Oleiharenicola sp. Vm1]|uniref:GNAT family N-acetyltransferase n=1 Tax=Oleiharenicola sp. Vm1 TaxID=3398393 RepID=UPI0039F4792D
MSNSAAPVRHNEAEHRYEIALEGHLAVAEYEFADGKQVFTHTLVPPEFRGRGYAEALVRTALNDAKAAGRKVVPACSYVAKFIERNKEFASLLA